MPTNPADQKKDDQAKKEQAKKDVQDKAAKFAAAIQQQAAAKKQAQDKKPLPKKIKKVVIDVLNGEGAKPFRLDAEKVGPGIVVKGDDHLAKNNIKRILPQLQFG